MIVMCVVRFMRCLELEVENIEFALYAIFNLV
jgi:hypothetical protein